LISLSTSFAGIGDSGLVRKVADGFVVVFLLANLVIRFSTMFHYPPYNGYIAACGAYPGFLLDLVYGGMKSAQKPKPAIFEPLCPHCLYI